MKQFIGNYNTRLKCSELMAQVLSERNKDVEYFHGHQDVIDSEKESTNYLRTLGYNEHNVKFKHYSYGVHFDSWFAEELGRIVNVKPLICVVSSIEPGCVVPWHIDYNPDEEQQKTEGTLKRFMCFIDKPQDGHVFMVERDVFYYEEQGNVYEYPDIHAYHAGSNAGLTTKYLLTMTGVTVN